MVVDEPAQMAAAETLVPTIGKEVILIVNADVFVQPLALVPITVYVVADAGETTMEVPDSAPGFHT